MNSEGEAEGHKEMGWIRKLDEEGNVNSHLAKESWSGVSPSGFWHHPPQTC